MSSDKIFETVRLTLPQQNCRFHYVYPTEPPPEENNRTPLGSNDEDDYDYEEASYLQPNDHDWWEVECEHRFDEYESDTDSETDLSAEGPIESGRAWYIFQKLRMLYSCRNCQPLLKADDNRDYHWYLEFPVNVCTCDIQHHFLMKRWLCIPCFLREEAKAMDGRRFTAWDGTVVISLFRSLKNMTDAVADQETETQMRL